MNMNNLIPNYFIGTVEEYNKFLDNLRKRDIQRRRDKYIELFHKVPPQDNTKVFDEIMNYYFNRKKFVR